MPWLAMAFSTIEPDKGWQPRRHSQHRSSHFSTSGNGRGSSAEADRIGSVMEEESQHGVFCRAGRVDGGNADLRHGTKRRCHPQGEGAVYAGGYRGRACAASNLPTHRIRDRPNGADALPWFAPTRTAGYLHREPAGVSGAEAISDAQD